MNQFGRRTVAVEIIDGLRSYLGELVIKNAKGNFNVFFTQANAS